MNLLICRCFGAALLPALLAVASASAAPPETSSAVAPVSIPKIVYRARTLDNGLTVYSIENHKSPTVSIQVWYKVGGKNDPEGRSGFAHLFEHMMFKSTKNMRAEMFDRLTEDVGGENNAYTEDDRTVYHETVPSNYLETLLWAEADRMTSLNVDPSNFASERAVVEEEYRQRVLAPPYGRLAVAVAGHSFVAHPYRRETIGSIADLDAATIDDVRQFYKTFYRPDNAVLIVAGDFNAAQLDGWVDRYFGRIPRPQTDIPRVTVQEPARTGEKRYDDTGPNVPLPAVVINYLVPSIASEDAQALRVAEVILSSGESSRLYQSLVYRQQVAAEADARADLRADAGLFQFTTIAAGGKSLDAAEKATLSEIERLKTDPVSEPELAKARNQVIFGALGERETAEGQAAALGFAAVMQGNPERVNTDIARLQAVTATDIQRVARQYFTPENRVIIHYTRGDQASGTVTPATPPASPATASTETAPFQPTEQPPKPSAPRQVTFPTPTERLLPNGVRVITVPRSGTGLVNVVMAIRAGGALDPNGAAGLADFTASLLTRGTRTRSATQVAETVEALGGAIGSGAGWDSSTVTLSVLSSHLESALPVFAEVVRAPAFRADEIARLRAETLDGLTISLRSPGTIARYAAARVVFGDSAYGHAITGTPESLKAIQAAQIENFYRGRFQPKNAVVVFGGDITPDRAYALANRFFASWKQAGNAPPSAPPAVNAGKGGRVVVIDKPDAGQAAVVLARPGIRRADPRYFSGEVTNAILGGGYSSRLNQEIRIKRGLSYGAGSGLDARRHGGYFYATAQTRNEAVPEVASLLRSEAGRMGTATVTAEELATRKAALSGDYARALETGAGLTGQVATLAIYDLPLSLLSAYLPRVQAVTAAQVQDFARGILNPTEADIVVVGNGKAFLPEMRKRFSHVEVIPVDQLDLNRSDLKKR